MKTLIHYILFLITLLVIGCSKTEDRVEAGITKPFLFDEMKLESMNGESIVFSSKLLEENKDKITDYGIVIGYTQSGETNEEKISLGTTPKLGPISYEYKPKSPFKVATDYYVQFYIQTAKGFYTSHKLLFTAGYLQVTEGLHQYANTGDTISVGGNFDGIDKDFKLKNSINDVSIPFTINKEKNLITFIVPQNSLDHGAGIRFNLVKQKSNTEKFIFELCETIIVGKLNPPSEKKVYLTDAITFTGTNLPGPYSYRDELWLLIGGQKFKFQSTISLAIIDGLKGTSFKIGYLSGKDTIIFPHPIELLQPEGQNIHISPKVVHPSSNSLITGDNFEKFYGAAWNTIYVGKQVVEKPSYYDQGFSFKIPQMKDGTYTVTISNPFFNISSTETVEVRKLKIADISTTTVYPEEKITIKGNFIDYTNYVVRIGEHKVIALALNGEITFNNSSESSGTKTVSVCYVANDGETTFADKTFNVKSEKGFISSVNKTEGYPGDVITVKGKGFSVFATYKLGNTPIIMLNRTSDEFTFLIPTNLPKGKSKISINMGDYILESPDYLDIK